MQEMMYQEPEKLANDYAKQTISQNQRMQA